MTHTRNMVLVSILSAVSFLLMLFQFPLIPSASFLQVDFSIVPILIGLVVFNYKSALAILLIRSFLKLLLNNGGISSLIGLPMNIIASAIFVLAFALIWKKKQATIAYIFSSLVGTIAMTLVMVMLNYIYAMPLYALYAHFDISATLGTGNYLFFMVVPFNLLQGLTFSVVFYLVYQFVGQPLLKFATP